jgi:hypothetical protein
VADILGCYVLFNVQHALSKKCTNFCILSLSSTEPAIHYFYAILYIVYDCLHGTVDVVFFHNTFDNISSSDVCDKIV